MINFDDSVISYNKQAMIALKNDQKSVSLNLLDQAQSILKKKPIINRAKLQSLTFNNLGCYYKRLGDYRQSLSYFSRALNENPSDKLTKSGILLNLCNLHSILINHSKALSYALEALELLQSFKDDSDTYYFSLLTAYLTIANEQENLSQYEISKSFYKKALNLALKKFPNSDQPKRIKEKIEVLLSKIFFSNDGSLFSYKRKLRTKNHLSLSPSHNIERKYDKKIDSPLNLTAGHKKNNIQPRLPLIKNKREKGRLDFRDLFKESKERVKTSLPSSRKPLKDGKFKKLKVQSKTPEIFPVAFKVKLDLI